MAGLCSRAIPIQALSPTGKERPSCLHNSPLAIALDHAASAGAAATEAWCGGSGWQETRTKVTCKKQAEDCWATRPPGLIGTGIALDAQFRHVPVDGRLSQLSRMLGRESA